MTLWNLVAYVCMDLPVMNCFLFKIFSGTNESKWNENGNCLAAEKKVERWVGHWCKVVEIGIRIEINSWECMWGIANAQTRCRTSLVRMLQEMHHRCVQHVEFVGFCSERQFVISRWCDWIEQGLTSPPTQYRLSGRLFYRSKDPTNSIKVLKEKMKTFYANVLIFVSAVVMCGELSQSGKSVFSIWEIETIQKSLFSVLVNAVSVVHLLISFALVYIKHL